MRIIITGTLDKIEDTFTNLSTNLVYNEIPANWFDEDITGHLQAIFIQDSGSLDLQFGRTTGLQENPEDDMLTLTELVWDELCVDLSHGPDIIRCHSYNGFRENALLGNWSMRRKQNDDIKIVLNYRE